MIILKAHISHSQVINALTSIRSVNRTDAATLLSSFGSVRNIVRASKESIALCPGIGMQKAARLQLVLKQPFLKGNKSAAAAAATAAAAASIKLHSQQKAITSFLKKS